MEQWYLLWNAIVNKKSGQNDTGVSWKLVGIVLEHINFDNLNNSYSRQYPLQKN